MKKKLGFTILISSIFFFLGCSSQYTKRFHSITVTPIQENCNFVQVSAFTIDAPSAASKSTLLQLSPEGQAAFIKEIGKTIYNAETLLKLLGKNIGSKKTGNIIDLTKFKKRVVFSVEKCTLKKCKKQIIEIKPADRIDQLLIKLSNLKNAVFVSWDKFDTKYETVDLGKISNTQSFNLDLEIPIKAPELTAKTGIGQNLNEEVLLRQRYVVLSGHLQKENAILSQQGVTGIDLAGNFSIDFTIIADSDPSKQHTVLSLSNLWKGPTPNKPKEIAVSFRRIKYAISSDPISCDLDLHYSFRHVTKFGNTISEADDVITLYRCHDNNEKKIELIGKSELRVRFFYIAANQNTRVSAKHL